MPNPPQGTGKDYDDDRYGRVWDDEGLRPREDSWRQNSALERNERAFQSRDQGYPGSFEDHHHVRGDDDRARYTSDRSVTGSYGRGWDDRLGPRGYGPSDGDRPHLGTGGTQHTGYARSDLQPSRPELASGGHRGKGPHGYQRSDERIKELVCEALTDDDLVDASNITVEVHGGEVILSGTVDDRRMKRHAEDCIESIRGVKDIQNQLRVLGEARARGMH